MLLGFVVGIIWDRAGPMGIRRVYAGYAPAAVAAAASAAAAAAAAAADDDDLMDDEG